MQTLSIYSQNSKKKPLVSFIVTYFNQPLTMLQQCINSILQLSLSEEEREVIVIDDGSELSPLNELLNSDEHIVYVRTPNKGVSAARNLGITISKGEYIQFIDADDYLLVPAYEHCLSLTRSKEIDVVLFGFATKANEKSSMVDEEPVDGAMFMKHNNISGAVWNYLFRKSLLINLRFSQEIAYGEDEEFTPQLLLSADKVTRTQAKAYFYRQHSESVIHKRDEQSVSKRLNDNFEVICRLNQKAENLPYQEQEALRRRVAQLSMDYLYNTITLTRDAQLTEKAVRKLYKEGLFPLPSKDYTRKYKLFRRMVNSKAGRKLLLIMLPKQK